MKTRRRLKSRAKIVYAPTAGSVLQERLIELPDYTLPLFTPRRYKVIYGGRGGARSWSVARALLIRAAQKRLRILCAREMQSSLRDSVHQLLRDQIELMGLPGFHVTDREIRHANGSLFLFEGLRHNATKIKSMEGIDVCWVEEAERISKESWSILIPTIRKTGSEIWVTFNPDQESDSTYQRFIIHPPKDCWSLKVSWHNNPWLSDVLREEKDYAYAVDPEAADWVWGGNTRKHSAAQIMKNKWIVAEFTVPRDARGDPLWGGPYQGQDFGFGADPAAAVRLWIHADVLYVEYEMWKQHLELDQTANQLEDDIPHFADYITRADSARPDSISYLRRHGVPRIIGAHKHAGSVEEGIRHLRSYQQIVIHPRCVHAVAEHKLYSYKVDERSGDILPIIVDKHNHLIDSMRYALDPMIRPAGFAGLLFSQGERRTVCAVCDSYLPDDGECPHCGAFHDAEGKLIDATVHDDEQNDDVLETVHTNGNGNGNGTAVLNTRLRGLNA